MNPNGTPRVGGAYRATVNLVSGDVNNDNVVNFVDYAQFISQYGQTDPADANSLTWTLNCDFDGSGQVNALDWQYFFPNYGQVGATAPTAFITSYGIIAGGGGVNVGEPGYVNPHDPHLTRMPVKQLISLGVKDAAKWDLNHDGWVDMSELYTALLAKEGKK